MAQLLQEVARKKQGPAPVYASRLLLAMGQIKREEKIEESKPVSGGFIEPLSDRELQVLRLLGSELNGPEIARQLMVSLNTFNTHTKNIYIKLEVNNRRAAVRRAEELHLL